MRRLPFLIALLALGACSGVPAPTATPSAPTQAPTTAPTGQNLPFGTLILNQLNNRIAQTPEGKIITLSDDQFGVRGSSDGRYGVIFSSIGGGQNLVLADYSTTPPTTTNIPEGIGFGGPVIVWQPDASGFAFYDFPLTGVRTTPRILWYYDLASGQSRRLIEEDAQSTRVPSAVAFSPDGRYLLYSYVDDSAEGVGGGSAGFVLNMDGGQPIPLPREALFGFAGWLKDSSGFMTLRSDPQTGRGSVTVYFLRDLDAPVLITPQGASDSLVSCAPSGRRLVVASVPRGSTDANIYMVDLASDALNARRMLTSYTGGTTPSITSLIWGNDGIYFSLSRAATSSLDTTWRMDLDGKNATQLAQGTLLNIVGVR
ncbi:MAG: hypothetical protein OHK0023_23130 [Anaerolineae bacterium]